MRVLGLILLAAAVLSALAAIWSGEWLRLTISAVLLFLVAGALLGTHQNRERNKL